MLRRSLSSAVSSAVALCTVLLCTSSLQAAELNANLKIVRYGPAGQEKPGLVDASGQLRDLSAHVTDITPDVLSDEGLQRLAAIPLDQLPVVPGEPRMGVPLTGIGKIIAVGFNYVNHAAEMQVELPTEPLIFMKATSALTGPFDDVIQPRNGVKLDYESELVVVIGTRAQYVSERAFQRERGGQFTKGKSADTFAPLGPWLVTRDSITDVQNLSIWSEVNGEMRQQGNTADMVFGVAKIVSHLSEFMTLYPGDVIYTGTPAGVGDGMVPPVYLKPGDVVRLGIEGLDEQRQTIVPSH